MAYILDQYWCNLVILANTLINIFRVNYTAVLILVCGNIQKKYVMLSKQVLNSTCNYLKKYNNVVVRVKT